MGRPNRSSPPPPLPPPPLACRLWRDDCPGPTATEPRWPTATDPRWLAAMVSAPCLPRATPLPPPSPTPEARPPAVALEPAATPAPALAPPGRCDRRRGSPHSRLAAVVWLPVAPCALLPPGASHAWTAACMFATSPPMTRAHLPRTEHHAWPRPGRCERRVADACEGVSPTRQPARQPPAQPVPPPHVPAREPAHAAVGAKHRHNRHLLRVLDAGIHQDQHLHQPLHGVGSVR